MSEQSKDPNATPGSLGQSSGKPSVERRRYPRYEYASPVFVRILVEEETFSPLQFPGHTINISEGGLLMCIEALPDRDYRTLIRSQRMVRVRIDVEECEPKPVLFGRIVWYDFRQTAGGTTCLLGISFESLDGKAQEALQQIVDKLKAEKEALPDPTANRPSTP